MHIVKGDTVLVISGNDKGNYDCKIITQNSKKGIFRKTGKTERTEHTEVLPVRNLFRLMPDA